MIFLLTVLAEEEKIMIMERSLNAIVRIGRAFPPLLDDLVHLLLSFGRVATSHVSLLPTPSPRSIGKLLELIFNVDFNSNQGISLAI